jgi:hypothetical protein
LWPRWLAFNQRLGDFQSRLFLAWFYFLLVTPFALILIATSDRLHRKPPESASMWLARARPPTRTSPPPGGNSSVHIGHLLLLPRRRRRHP